MCAGIWENTILLPRLITIDRLWKCKIEAHVKKNSLMLNKSRKSSRYHWKDFVTTSMWIKIFCNLFLAN